MDIDKTVIIVPAYNEDQVIGKTLRGIRGFLRHNKINGDILVVNDGSSDKTGEIANRESDVVLTHRRNCGLGAALATGIEYARRQGYASCVTFDSDGQHDPADIKKALSALAQGADVVIGSRFLGSHSRMPRNRQFVLKVSNFVTWLFFGVVTTDSQSGFRALSRRAIQSINLKSNRMEVSSEFFSEIKGQNLVLREIPIHIRYTDYSLSKGQSNSNAVNVLIKLIYRVLK